MGSYNNVFGGPNVQPATVSYITYGTQASPLLASVQLTWPTSYVDNNDPVAQIIDTYPNVGGLTLTMPDATQASNGQTAQINNRSANSININDFTGGLIVTIGSGLTYSIYLTDNSTSAGVWHFFQNGAIPSAAQAGPLVGLGLINLGNTLNTNVPATTIAVNYTLVANDRAKLFAWTGGVGTLTLPTFASVGQGYYFSVNNSGNGILTLSTTDGATFDNSASTTFTLNPGQSASIIATAPGAPPLWNTLGFGTPTYYSINVLPDYNIAAGGSFTLSALQASKQIIKFIGNLAANATINFPGISGAWYLWNNTTAAFTVEVQVTGGGGTSVLIPQGQKLIVYSDGANMYSTPTIVSGTSFSDGTVGAPSIGFGSDPSSGFYKISAGVMGYSSGGNKAVTLGASGISLFAAGAFQLFNAGNTQSITFNPGALAASTSYTLPQAFPANSGGILASTTAGVMSFTSASYPATTVVNQLLYSSATNTIAGLATANNSVLITSAGGVPSISTTIPAATQLNITQVGTITTGVWNGTAVDVAHGGTGLTTLTTAYGVVCAGTSATGALQNAGAGTANQAFVSNGAAALPSWKTVNAVKADQISATSNTLFVTPGVQQYHPSALKAAISFNGTGPVTYTSYNCSVARNGVGNYTLTFPVPFSSSNYYWSISIGDGTGSFIWAADAPIATPTGSTFQFIVQRFVSPNFSALDATYISCQFFGTQ